MIAKVKEFYNTIEKKVRLYFLFSVFDTCVAGVGMLVYGILTATYGPVWVRNQYYGLWLTSILIFYTLQSIYIEIKKWTSRIDYFLDVGFFVISVIVPLLMTIFYGISHRIDGIIWSIYIFAVNLTNLYILYMRYGSNVKPLSAKKINNNEITESDKEDNVLAKWNQEEASPKNSCAKKTAIVINTIVRIIFIIFCCFLLNGAIVEGTGKLKFPARGKFIDVKLNDGSDRTISIHYLCDGPVNSNLPVFVFEGDASHGLADYLSLHELLKQNNRRSCIYDKPGNGYSNYLFTDLKSYFLFYHNFFSTIGEKVPFHFVGWGGGGQIIYEYAYRNPEMVSGLTFLDTSPVNIEFTIPTILKNWTDSEAKKYKNQEFSSRKTLLDLINGLGVPWGIMSLFISPVRTYFSKFNDEASWYFLTEKTWITQEFFMPQLKTEQDIFKQYKINQSIPINIMMTYKTSDQIIKQKCTPRKLAPSSPDCQYEIKSNELSQDIRSNLLNLSQNGKLVKCTDDQCDLGYFVGLGSNFTVNNLLSF